jgi:shikimate dehydrogenase
VISGHSRVFAILGKPVSHSLSPAMHNAAFRALGLDAIYVALACEGSDVAGAMHLLAHSGGGGNVTVPHKAGAAAALDLATPLVRRLEACNTFWIEEGALHGDNTDVAGVSAALEQLDLPPGPWLVAGTGGAARGVVGAAAAHGATVAVRSRDAGRRSAFERWMAGLGVQSAQAAECTVLVNATPLGLHPGDHLPIAADQAPGAIVALDLVYSPHGTTWSRAMREAGLRAADGREVLVAQGAAAFRRWFPEEDPPTEVMRAAVEDALR